MFSQITFWFLFPKYFQLKSSLLAVLSSCSLGFISQSSLHAGISGYIALFLLLIGVYLLLSLIIQLLVICAHCLLTNRQMPYPIHIWSRQWNGQNKYEISLRHISVCIVWHFCIIIGKNELEFRMKNKPSWNVLKEKKCQYQFHFKGCTKFQNWAFSGQLSALLLPNPLTEML
jgi:hypothetical protein